MHVHTQCMQVHKQTSAIRPKSPGFCMNPRF